MKNAINISSLSEQQSCSTRPNFPLLINPTGHFTAPKYADKLPAFAGCHGCCDLVQFNVDMGNMFWAEARVRQHIHTLDLEIISYEPNFYQCGRCTEKLIDNNSHNNRKLHSLLRTGHDSPLYYCGAVFSPFHVNCEKCLKNISTGDEFVLIGISTGVIHFDTQADKAAFCVACHVPFQAYCIECGSSMYGDNLEEALKW